MKCSRQTAGPADEVRRTRSGQAWGGSGAHASELRACSTAGGCPLGVWARPWSPHTVEVTAPNTPRLYPALRPQILLSCVEERSCRWKKSAPSPRKRCHNWNCPTNLWLPGIETLSCSITPTELILTFCQVFFNLAQNNLSQVSTVLSWQILKCYSNWGIGKLHSKYGPNPGVLVNTVSLESSPTNLRTCCLGPSSRQRPSSAAVTKTARPRTPEHSLCGPLRKGCQTQLWFYLPQNTTEKSTVQACYINCFFFKTGKALLFKKEF